MTAAAIAGWALVAGLAVWVVGVRRRLELVVRAEHELRGAAGALSLAAERMHRDPRARGHARALLLELDRLRIGLEDLGAARKGRRSSGSVSAVRLDALAARAEAAARAAAPDGRELRLDWRGGPAPVVADRARLSQALANLTANALEHGSGPVEIRGRRSDRTVRIEVRDGGPGARRSERSGERGRGLAIAADAARDAGGRLLLERSADGTTAAMELPLVEGSPRAR